jgi:hypothetical protein
MFDEHSGKTTPDVLFYLFRKVAAGSLQETIEFGAHGTDFLFYFIQFLTGG